MIWCLHGNLGLAGDWDLLSSHEESPFKGEIIRKVDLWRYQDCRSIGLAEFGEIFSSEVSAQDEEPTLIGYSMGGRLVLHALLANPTLWKRVILISVHPGLSTEEERKARRISDAEWSAKALSMNWTDFLKAWDEQEVFLKRPDSLQDRHLLQPRAQAVARAFNAWSLGEQEDLREKVSVLSCPVTLITGEQDRKYSSLGTEFSFLKAEHHRIPEAGHRTLWENPEEVLPLLR